MAFDFPASPADGATYTPAGGPAYVYRSATGAWNSGTGAALINAYPTKNPPAAGDLMPLADSAAGYSNAKMTWGQEKAALNTSLSFLPLAGGTLTGDLTVSRNNPNYILDSIGVQSS